MREQADRITRRAFFGRSATGLGTAALATLLGRDAQAGTVPGVGGYPHFAPKAKRVVLSLIHISEPTRPY